ncbi:MAG: hypothetical protein AAF125_16260 [Chloroflexota bacterium]
MTINVLRWFALLAALLAFVSPAHAHGVVIDLSFDEATGELTVAAAFDTGEVLDEAQIAVFAPSDIVTPWLTGVANVDGVFTFTPDFSDEGEWTIQVRKAGHGGLANTMIDASMAPDASTSEADLTAVTTTDAGRIVITGDAVFEVTGDVVINTTGGSSLERQSLTDGLSPAQVIIMSVSVVWGAIGTALYFSGRGKQATANTGTDDAH